MNKGKTSNFSGITLIALVITVIVLLILAGISISMISGDNGILQKATDAKEQTGIGQEKEIVALAYNSALAKKVSNGDSSEVTAGDLNPELTNQGASANGNNPITVTFTVSKRQYTINSNGIIEYAGTTTEETDENTPKFELTIAGTEADGGSLPAITTGTKATENSKYTDSNGDVAVIPSGFKVSSTTGENTIAGGLVIKDDDGNEFVWIPVEKDQTITLDVVTEENITGIKLIDPTGAELSIGTATEKKFKKENIEPTYNGIYKAEVTTASGTQNKTLLVRSLYATDTFNDYYTDEKIEGEVFDLWNSRVGNPGDVATVCQRLGLGNNKTMADFKTWFLGTSYTELEDHKNSVNTNGGFYVGRYEAGIGEQRSSGNSSTDGDTMTAPLSKVNVFTYNYVTRSQASKIAKKMYTGKSYLLTNAAWDRTLGWIINGNDKSLTLQDIVADSKSWGNYSNSSFTATETGSLAKTGAFGDNTKVNNIYDLAGNVFEWTSATSPSTTLPCVRRGGYYNVSGSDSFGPASIRVDNSENVIDVPSGFRVALFL